MRNIKKHLQFHDKLFINNESLFLLQKGNAFVKSLFTIQILEIRVHIKLKANFGGLTTRH
jgi:hypothetical protein